MNRKPLVAGMASVMVLALLAGCSKPTGTKTDTPKDQPKQEKVVRYNAGADFRSLDPALMTDTVSFAGENQLFEGLVRITAAGTVGGMATKWDVTDNGTKYTFHLRDNIKWSNGDPITAQDWVYSWTRSLNPETGSEYAYQLYYIKGGEKLNTVAAKIKGADGKETDNPKYKEELDAAIKGLGVKATDAKTLEVTLEAPTPYFLDLTAFPTLMPVNPKIVAANKDWATKPATYVSNGPFTLQSWEAKKQAVFVKNPGYWDAANVKVDKLVYYMVEENSTSLQLFESNQIDEMEAPPGQEIPRLTKENKIKYAPTFGTYWYLLNVKTKPFDDVRVRKAFAMSMDRKAITENITKGGEIPAYAVVAPGANDADGKTDYRKNGGDYFKEDVAAAQKFLADAGFPGGKGFPDIEIVYNTSDRHKAVAEAVIEMWKKNLGITSIKAINVENKVRLDRATKGDFTILRYGWTGDYLDPMTYMDMYVTGGGNNNAGYSNKAVDTLIAAAKATGDQKVRMDNMHKAEKIMIQDDMVFIPVYYYTTPYLESPKLSGVYRNALGVIDFKLAEIKQ